MDTNNINQVKRDEKQRHFIENKYANKMLKKEEGGGGGGNSVPLIYVSCKERVVPLDSHRTTRGCYFQMNCFRHQRKSVLFPPEPDQVNIIRKHH